MLIAQAKTRFRVYPSPAASHWVHKEYLEQGGRFVESTHQLSRNDKHEHDKKQHDKDHNKK